MYLISCSFNFFTSYIVFNYHSIYIVGILFNDNNAYRNQRRFIHRTLRDFGFGKATLENILISEADHIVDHFQSLNGRPVQPQLIFNVGVLNVLWKIVADRRWIFDKESCIHMKKRLMKDMMVHIYYKTNQQNYLYLGTILQMLAWCGCFRW